MAQNEPLRTIDNNQVLSVWLDLIRWVSAVEVLIFHVRHRLLLPLGQVDHASRSIAFYLLNVISGFGAPSVLIFFVLSGFLVGGGIPSAVQRRWSF